MTTMSLVGECFFWYRLTRVVPDKFHRAVKRLCVCVCVVIVTITMQLEQIYKYTIWLSRQKFLSGCRQCNLADICTL